MTNLNKRRMRKNIKQKNISVLKKAEEEYLKRLYNRLCHEMFLDKYFEDEERIIFPTCLLPVATKPAKITIMFKGWLNAFCRRNYRRESEESFKRNNQR